MRDYILFSPRLWTSESFWSLDNDQDRFAYVYLRTSPHQTGAGCYSLPLAYMAADLRWSQERVVIAIAALVKANLIEFDIETKEVRIVDWFETGDLMNPKHYTGVKRRIDQLASARLREAAHEAAVRAWADGQARATTRSVVGNQAAHAKTIPGSLRGPT